MIGDRNRTQSADESARTDDEVGATDLFEVLADPSLRRLLRELHEIDGRVCIHELADRLPDRNADRLAVRLHHSYLSKLDDCGLAEYDAESHAVVAEIPPWVEPYLDVVDE